MAKRSDIYKALRDHAKAGLTNLKFLDLQKGQFQDIKKNYPVPLPALLIELSDYRYSNAGEFLQKGDGIISIYLYQNNFADSFLGAERESESISLLDNFDDIYQVFEGFAIDGITPLNRVVEYKPQYGLKWIMFRVDFRSVREEQKAIEKQGTSMDVELVPKFKFR